MKLVTTRSEAGRYIVSAAHNGVIRFFEICKDYNTETGEYFGKYWYIYETTNDQYEWWAGHWWTKAEAVKFLKRDLQTYQG
jgi:hypothetical protein